MPKIKNTIYKCLVIFPIISIFMAGVAFAQTPPAQACFDQFTGVAYFCGPNSPNTTTSIPICDTNYSNCSKYGPDQSGNFTFPGGQCFTLTTAKDNSNNSATVMWVGPEDCNQNVYKNPLNQQIPNTNDPAALNCAGAGNTSNPNQTGNYTNCNVINRFIDPAINFLSATVGIVVVLTIIISGIQYSTAGSNPQAASAAKKRIMGAILAAIAYLFLYGFLQFIVPGGFFNG